MSFVWFFPQDIIETKTPSRVHGIPLKVETRYRKEGAKLVINAANTLKLRYDTVATGVVFYHRFFMMQSFKEFNRWVVAAACLLLAGKVEETPKQCKVILKVAKSILNEQQWAAFGSNPKEELMTHERILLQTIKFDLQIDHPYTFILKYAKGLKGEKGEIEKLVQAAWTFVNDSLVTTLSITWEPNAVAVAFLHLAAKLNKVDLHSKTGSSNKTRFWWRQYVDTLDEHDLDCICHTVLDIYQESGKDITDDTSDEEPITRSQAPPQATPTPPSAAHTPITPSTMATPTTWVPSTVANMFGHLHASTATSMHYQQTIPSHQTSQHGLGINPLQALQNIQTVQTPQQPPALFPQQTQVPSLMPTVYQQQQQQPSTFTGQVATQSVYPLLPQQQQQQQPIGAVFTAQPGHFPGMIGQGSIATQQQPVAVNSVPQNFSSYQQPSMPSKPQSLMATPVQSTYPGYGSHNVGHYPPSNQIQTPPSGGHMRNTGQYRNTSHTQSRGKQNW